MLDTKRFCGDLIWLAVYKNVCWFLLRKKNHIRAARTIESLKCVIFSETLIRDT